MKKINQELKIIFIGTPEFGAIVLEGLVNGGYKPVLVISETDKPVGRKQTITPPPVKVIAQKYNIAVEQPKKIIDSKSQILDSKPDLIIAAAYGQVLPKDILKISKYGCLNIHPSLLPKYRGASPIQYTILNGDEETGVTIIKMTEKVDAGPIIANEKLKMKNEKLTYGELHNKLAGLGVKLLIDIISDWINGKIEPKSQNESGTTYTKVLIKEDGKIDWNNPAEYIERQVRAFYPWPGTFTFWQVLKGKLLTIKILRAEVFKSPLGQTYQTGKVLVVPPNRAGVQCGKDFLLIEEMQLEGGKPMDSEEFLRGHPDFIGTILSQRG